MSTSTSRARQVFDAHVAAVAAGDLDAILATYAPDAVHVDTDRLHRGHDEIRAVFARATQGAQQLAHDVRSDILEADGLVYVAWRRGSGADEIVGTDTFVIPADRITAHTHHAVTLATGAPYFA